MKLILLMMTVFLTQGLAYHKALGQSNPGAILQQQRKTFEYNRWRQQFEQYQKDKKANDPPVGVEPEAGAIQTEQKKTHDVNPPQEKEEEKK